MKKLIVFTALLCILIQVHAQFSAFRLTRPSLKEIPVTEKLMQGKKFDYNFPITVSKDYFPGAGSYKLANPLVYHRKDSSGRMEVSYFYSLPDNVVRLTEYSIDRTAADTTALKQLFQQNSQAFTTYFNAPPAETNEIHPAWWQTINTWQNERVHVRQFIVIGENTYRLRVLVSWNGKSSTFYRGK